MEKNASTFGLAQKENELLKAKQKKEVRKIPGKKNN